MKEKNKNTILLLRKNSNIMLLDDEEMLLVATQRYLNAKQFKVITSKSAIEGLERIKEEKIDG